MVPDDRVMEPPLWGSGPDGGHLPRFPRVSQKLLLLDGREREKGRKKGEVGRGRAGRRRTRKI